MSLNGKTALVTGASRGIGRAIALRFAEDGANVAVIYAGSADKAEAVVNEITALGVNAKAYRCNVADSAAVNETVKAVTNDLGKIDILVNNAGITRDGLMLRMKDEDFDAVLDTNLKGAFNMIRACYSGFIRKKSGRIINISSVSGIMGNAGQANYSASKAGVIGLTKSVARELASRGITCNAVAPGFIQTDMTENLGDNNPLLNSIPLGRMGKPEDIAAAVAFLASDSAAYITGEVLKVDGGLAI
ncbi:3-oxoacyl-[acyl-carrier-protein] reductase [Hominenteromicrobium sp.]|uniref:3-oxoacyl-[acyl-carrier-protein] reductase n=1 Tax=Hominenteromicrobium sp. TaxID=3073581 RepID=UPI003A938207